MTVDERCSLDLPADEAGVACRMTVFSDVTAHCCQAPQLCLIVAIAMPLTIIDDHEFRGIMSDKSKRLSRFTPSLEVRRGRVVREVRNNGNGRRRGTDIS